LRPCGFDIALGGQDLDGGGIDDSVDVDFVLGDYIVDAFDDDVFGPDLSALLQIGC